MEGIERFLSELFQAIINLSLVGSYVILLIILVRFMLRKAPRWCSYALWGIVFLRLICPVFPEAHFSLIPSQLKENALILYREDVSDKELVLKEIAQADLEAVTVRNGETGNVAEEALQVQKSQTKVSMEEAQKQDAGTLITNELSQGINELQQKENTTDVDAFGRVFSICSYVWLFGVILLAVYHTFSYWKLKIKVKNALEAEYGVREIQGEHLSFVMGIFKPTIYLSEDLDEESRRVILCHESVHLQRKDYLFKPTALAICCLHWFNPLVWLAFHLMNKDCEMSCDERVVRLLGEESKKVYSYALLDEATRGERKRYQRGTVCALLSFGEDSVKSRISHVLHYKKASLWIVIGAIILLVVLVIGLLSNPGSEPMTMERAREIVVSEGGITFVEQIAMEYGRQSDSTLVNSQLSAEMALDRFAWAFADRDGKALYQLSSDEENFENWNMVIPLEDGSYAFGDSSPWAIPGNYQIEYTEGEDEATIRFIMSNSAPEHYVAKERVKLVKEGELYFVDHVDYKMYSEIESRQELAEIFDLESNNPFNGINTGYDYSFPRIILQHILNKTNPEYYAIYTDPVTSAKAMLHLGAGTGEITEQLYFMGPQNPLSSSQGEGSVVNVRYTFDKDGSTVDIPMVLAEESENIWVLSTGDLSQADAQENAPLPNEAARLYTSGCKCGFL